MPSVRKCAECGTDIQPDSPGGYCGQCLLGLGLETQTASQSSTPGTAVIGTKLQYFGDYELIEEIARGGMGIVFKARQISLNRLVAVKLISTGALVTQDLVKRFKAEAEAAASLAHPNIVPIYEIGEHQGQHYFSMGLIDGPNLRTEIANRESRITDSRHGARLVSTIARAVHYAHQRGVLHRDIKPSNILLDAKGEPHLTDFGLAKLVQKESTLTHTNAVMGTPAYMAPEQARGETKDVTTAADVYGLGAVLYETLTGSPPFAGGTSMETIRQVLDQEPRRPSLWNPAVDRDLETICLKCLEKDAQRRYNSAEAFADDLDHWLRSEPITARRVNNYERVKKWVRRRPAIAALTASLSVALLAGAVGVTLQWRRAEAGAERLRRNLYASDMNIAFQSWEAGEAERTRALLRNQVPRSGEEDLRGWEWRYLWSGAEPQELGECKSPDTVLSIAYAPDGKTFITHGYGSPRLWDAASRRPITHLGDYGWGYDAAFSPDGNLFLTTHADSKQICVWDAHRQQFRGMFTNHTQMVACAAFIPNGNAIVSAAGKTYSTHSPGELKLWDSKTFREIADFKGVECALFRCDLSADGRLVAASGFGPVVQVWELNSQRKVGRLTGHDTKSKGGVTALRFSPNGQVLATGDFGGTIRLWNLETSEAIVLGSHRDTIISVAFSPNGKRLASTSYDHTVKVWNTTNPGESVTLRGHSSRVSSVAFAPDGETLASCEQTGVIKFWSASLTSGNNVFAHNEGHAPASYSPDGRFLAWGDGGKAITIWDLTRTNGTQRIGGYDFAFSPAGNLLVIVSTTDRLAAWSLNPFAEIPVSHDIAVDRSERPPLVFSPLAYSPGGDRLAVITPQGEIVVLLVRDWQEQARIGTGLRGACLLFAPDGESLLTAGPNNEVTQWRIKTRERIGTFIGHSSGITTAGLSPDGRLLATGSLDTTVRVWDLATRREVGKYVGGAGVIHSLAFSRDGKTVAAGSFEGVIQLWNVASGQQVGTLQGHISFVRSLAFSPDGNTLASSSMDNTLRLWKAPSWAEVTRAEQTPP